MSLYPVSIFPTNFSLPDFKVILRSSRSVKISPPGFLHIQVGQYERSLLGPFQVLSNINDLNQATKF